METPKRALALTTVTPDRPLQKACVFSIKGRDNRLRDLEQTLETVRS